MSICADPVNINDRISLFACEIETVMKSRPLRFAGVGKRDKKESGSKSVVNLRLVMTFGNSWI
jgi:hypothetical protein